MRVTTVLRIKLALAKCIIHARVLFQVMRLFAFISIGAVVIIVQSFACLCTGIRSRNLSVNEVRVAAIEAIFTISCEIVNARIKTLINMYFVALALVRAFFRSKILLGTQPLDAPQFMYKFFMLSEFFVHVNTDIIIRDLNYGQLQIQTKLFVVYLCEQYITKLIQQQIGFEIMQFNYSDGDAISEVLPSDLPQIKQNKQSIVGGFKLNHLMYPYMALILVTPMYTYHMAVTKKEQPPFPHATVTNTACHYPQDIFFRLNMTAAGGLLIVLFHSIFKWVQIIANKSNYPGNTYAYMYWPTILGVIGYLIAIGTIDGAGTGDAHTIGAVYFFVMMYFAIANITVVCHKIRQWDTKTMTYCSLFQKVLVASYLSIIWVYCLVGLISQALSGSPTNDDDKYIVIVEWNLVFAGLVWVVCFHGDWKNVSIVLVSNKAANGQVTLGMDYIQN